VSGTVAIVSCSPSLPDPASECGGRGRGTVSTVSCLCPSIGTKSLSESLMGSEEGSPAIESRFEYAFIVAACKGVLGGKILGRWSLEGYWGFDISD
jgi:hypothetical protein